MEPVAPPPRPLDPDATTSCRPTITKTLPSFPNGTLKKHHLLYRPPPPPPPPLPPAAEVDSLYRECLKNHAASLGGHALDGCGEFMPSPSATADPTSLKCAACGCHRNFHRRLPDPLPNHHQEEGEDEMDGAAGGDDAAAAADDDRMEEEEEEEEKQATATDDRARHQSSSSPPPYFSSAPHMLLALSTGLAPGAPGANLARSILPAVTVGPPPAAGTLLLRKRFRTKFSPAQKGRMQELSERLGWRMQKRDEGLVEEWCREIGVTKGVFKVWMHNNKHNFVPGSSRRGEICGNGSGSGSGGGGGGGLVIGSGVGGGGDGLVLGGGGGGSVGDVEGNSSGTLGVSSHVVNGSSSSS